MCEFRKGQLNSLLKLSFYDDPLDLSNLTFARLKIINIILISSLSECRQVL